MQKKLLIYTFFPYYPRLELELELADLNRNKGYDVTLISCMGGLVTCPQNPKHHKLKCLSCTSRLKAGHNWLENKQIKLKKLYNIQPKQQKIIDKILTTPLNNWIELKSIKIDNDDIGLAAFSEVVSHLRETKPNFKKNIGFAKKLLNNALIVHFSILNHLKEEKPDKFILFNGRISAYRPALRVGVSLGIDTKSLEVHFSNYTKYLLIDKTYPHNPNAIAKKILNAYKNSKHDEKEKIKIASIWYNERENGDYKKQYSFTQKQINGYGLTNIKKENNLKIGIFISSEDEFLCVDERKQLFYENQNDAIARITTDSKDENVQFIVRAHPHLIGLNNTQTKELKTVCSQHKNITYLPPESKVSTYELIDLCDIILVFGSTVGIEAVHKNKPTILMGAAIYRGFGGTIEPKSHKELIKILKESAKLKQIPKKIIPTKKTMQKAATIYAFGFIKMGVEQKYQKLNSFFKQSWIEKDGVRTYIRPHIIYRITDRIYWIPWFIDRVIKRIIYETKTILKKINKQYKN